MLNHMHWPRSQHKIFENLKKVKGKHLASHALSMITTQKFKKSRKFPKIFKILGKISLNINLHLSQKWFEIERSGLKF